MDIQTEPKPGSIRVDDLRCPLCHCKTKWSCGTGDSAQLRRGHADCQDGIGAQVSRRLPNVGPACDWVGVDLVRIADGTIWTDGPVPRGTFTGLWARRLVDKGDKYRVVFTKGVYIGPPEMDALALAGSVLDLYVTFGTGEDDKPFMDIFFNKQEDATRFIGWFHAGGWRRVTR